MNISNEEKIQNQPVEIARIALKRLTELKAPPTPENYVREYRRAAGLPIDEVAMSHPWTAGEETIEMVRSIVHAVTQIGTELATGVEQFDSESLQTLANLDQVQDPKDMAQLLRKVTSSALSIKQVIDVTRTELDATRRRLEEVSTELDRSQHLARTDTLTGLSNRRAMSQIILREIERAARSLEPFSIALLDIDHFKSINDKHGHDTGDRALVHLARLAESSLREVDEIFRYGGEEFVVVLPGSRSEGAYYVIDRMRLQVEKTPLDLKQDTLTFTFSAGVAEFDPTDNEETLLKRADKTLYEAKSAGRNRVLVAGASSQKG